MIYNDGWHEPDLGWHIYDGFEGKAYAYQATLTARTCSAQHVGLDTVISYISRDNSRSISLADRLGATFECESVLPGEPCHIYRHPREVNP